MDLKRIMQRGDEQFDAFIERAREEFKDTNGPIELVFYDGTIIKTDNITDENALNQIITEYENQKKQPEEIECLACVDLLEETLKEEKNKETIKSTERLNKLKENYDNLEKELIAEYKASVDMAQSLILNEEKMLQEKIGSIDKETRALKDNLSKHEEDVKIQKEKMLEEQQLLDKYKNRLDELKKEDNPNLNELKEVTDKVIYYKWSIEAYTEYIDFIINEHIEPTKIRLDELGATRKEIITQTKERENQIFNEYVISKYGEPTKVNGKNEINIANSPKLLQIAEEIEKEKAMLEQLEKQSDFDSIRTMIKDRKASPAELAEQLTLLTKNYENIELEDTLGINKGKIKDNTEKKESIKSRIKEYREKLEKEENFYNKEQMEEDKINKESIEKELENNKKELKELETQLRNYIRVKKLPELKSKRNKVKATIEYLENSIKNCEFPKEEVENYEKTIESLTREEEKLDRKIQKIKEDKKLIIPAVVKYKIKELEEEININNLELEELNSKINEDYIDKALMTKTQHELEKLEEELEILESKKDDFSKITIQDINNKIIENYMVLTGKKEQVIDEEEITKEELFGYEDAPKSLLQKLKESKFIKKAKVFLAGLVTGTIITATTIGILHANEPTNEVIIEDMADEDEIEPVDDYEDIDLEEPEITIADEVETTITSEIEDMQNDALQDIIDNGKNAIVYDNVHDAANESNPLEVRNNTISWENAKPGAIYAVKDGERNEINIIEAENYMNNGYDIVSAYTNEGEIIGFTSLTNTQNQNENTTGKSI